MKRNGMSKVRPRSPLYSVVLPVFNEDKNICELVDRTESVLKERGWYEIILVDDGSTDQSRSKIEVICELNPEIKSIFLSRNFGHQAAVSAGLEFASGDVVAVMDGDLQDPPEVLPEFFAKWLDGYDVVYGVRKKRPENFLKRSAYFIFYRLLSRTADIKIPLDSGDFCVMDRLVVNELNLMTEKNRFVRGIRAWVGFKQIGVEYIRHSRFAGSSKYSMSALFKLGYDGIFSFSKKPLLVATRLGVLITATSFLFAAYSLFAKIIYDSDPKGWASTIIIILFLGGVQLLVLGILGEYIARIFDEVKARPSYIVEHAINMDKSSSQNKVTLHDR